MLATIAVVLIAASGALALYSAWSVSAIERAHPPIGRLVDVDGGRIHLLELGRSDGVPVVLLHGASGNLGDMRLALGDRLAQHHRVILIDRPGHGWSLRPSGPEAASPARQAALIRQALEAVGVQRAVVVGHSWSGALATAYALQFPHSVAALLLLAPVTHPWPGGIDWHHHVLTAPVVGPFFARTLANPVGKLLMPPGVRSAFAPQEPPVDYIERAGAELLLRPGELIANAQDVAGLKAFVTAQAKRYREITAPTIVISGDVDDVVSLDIHSRAIAAMLPQARLVVLNGVGHMVQHVAREEIAQAVAELSSGAR